MAARNLREKYGINLPPFPMPISSNNITGLQTVNSTVIIWYLIILGTYLHFLEGQIHMKFYIISLCGVFLE